MLINYSLTVRCEKVYRGLSPPLSFSSNHCAGRWISQFSADHFTPPCWLNMMSMFCFDLVATSNGILLHYHSEVWFGFGLEAGPIDQILQPFISQYCCRRWTGKTGQIDGQESDFWPGAPPYYPGGGVCGPPSPIPGRHCPLSLALLPLPGRPRRCQVDPVPRLYI